MDRPMMKYSKGAGTFAFVWRLILTTGTGSIFGFLVARQAYDAAILAPTFIVLSFAYGLAIFLLVIMTVCRGTGICLGDALLVRLRNLLRLFVVSSLYFVAVYHLTNLYGTENHGVEKFLLVSGGIYTGLFWVGQVIVGYLVPMGLLYHPATRGSRTNIVLASVLVVSKRVKRWIALSRAARSLLAKPTHKISYKTVYSAGHSAGLIRDVQTVPEIMEHMIREYRAIVEKMPS